MTSETNRNLTRILVVEDEYTLAEEVVGAIADAGMIAIGPAANTKDAIDLVEHQDVDAALLDVNLGDEMVYPLADILTARKIPFVFCTGYDAPSLPARFEDVGCCEKPIDIPQAFRRLGLFQ
ncbi:CheY-like chemotaxis protein [Neorhizobium huautlense]|uniref:CheY-like chemotaxis protein n=1 Tax=Neorhizobium huautlense TaxID=67774 RepID=A0ABT9Q1N6_9HYPH|nr:response regulator [Neorhizobium huautlense]MDP9840632.1 CheY-like chemotaxis protein [Neorhizobium huautlense]